MGEVDSVFVTVHAWKARTENCIGQNKKPILAWYQQMAGLPPIPNVTSSYEERMWTKSDKSCSRNVVWLIFLTAFCVENWN